LYHKVLGNTFGMCVLQDFEALTPNLLARTIETVEGGGVVVVDRAADDLHHLAMVQINAGTETHYFFALNSAK
jgi:tRNA(Met) C34 N-acetyltransferase TmcA